MVTSLSFLYDLLRDVSSVISESVADSHSWSLQVIGGYCSGVLKDGIPGMFGFHNVGSHRTWLQLMCCAGLVVCPCISEDPEVRNYQIWS